MIIEMDFRFLDYKKKKSSELMAILPAGLR